MTFMKSTKVWHVLKLGICYYYGIGIEKDANKAVELYQKAAKQGLAAAQSYIKLYNKKKAIRKAVYAIITRFVYIIYSIVT